MTERTGPELAAALQRIQAQAAADEIRLTTHALQGMVKREIALDEILEAISVAQILEDYPDHRRGACCLLYGDTRSGRPLHIACTTERPVLIVITAYQPALPKWVTPTQRSVRK